MSRQLLRYRKYELDNVSNLKIWWFRNTKEKTPEKLLVLALVVSVTLVRDFQSVEGLPFTTAVCVG